MRHFPMALVAFCALLAGMVSAVAQDKIVVATPTKGLAIAPLFLAIDGGAMKRNGIDASVVVLNGGPPVIAALLSGDAQFATLADDALMELASSSNVICVYTYNNAHTQDLLVRNQILAARQVTRDLPWQERIRRLKGITMGVLALGGAGDLAGRWLWKESGLGPDDATIVRVGALPSQVAGLKQGTIDAFVTSSPAREIVEGQDIGQAIVRFDDVPAWKDEPYEGIEMLRNYLATHGDLTRRFVAAIAEAQKQIFDDPKAAAAILVKGSFSEMDASLIESSLTNTRNAFRVERMSDARWQRTVKSHATVNPAVANVQLKEGSQWTNEYYP